MINARAETLAEKPAFSDALERRRCVIIADGYYEWTGAGSSRTPFRFQLKNRQPFVLAGLWERWERGETSIESCTIVTTSAAPAVAHIHDRMPVILDFDASTTWLRPGSAGRDMLHLLRPYSREDLEMFPVSRAMNNPANDTEECLKRAEIMEEWTLPL